MTFGNAQTYANSVAHKYTGRDVYIYADNRHVGDFVVSLTPDYEAPDYLRLATIVRASRYGSAHSTTR